MIHHLFLKLDLWRARGELEAIQDYMRTIPRVDRKTQEEYEYYTYLVRNLEKQLAEYKWSIEFSDILALLLIGSFIYMIWG